MKLAAAALVVVLGGCARSAAPTETASEAPIAGIARFDGELGAAKAKRRVVALASPT
jgi:hypothetical protein